MGHPAGTARVAGAAAGALAASACMIAAEGAPARGALPARPLTGIAGLDQIVTVQARALPVALEVLFRPRAGGAGRRFRRRGDLGRGA